MGSRFHLGQRHTGTITPLVETRLSINVTGATVPIQNNNSVGSGVAVFPMDTLAGTAGNRTTYFVIGGRLLQLLNCFPVVLFQTGDSRQRHRSPAVFWEAETSRKRSCHVSKRWASNWCTMTPELLVFVFWSVFKPELDTEPRVYNK